MPQRSFWNSRERGFRQIGFSSASRKLHESMQFVQEPYIRLLTYIGLRLLLGFFGRRSFSPSCLDVSLKDEGLIDIADATASVQRRIGDFGPVGEKRPFYAWKNNNIIRAWDRGSRYLEGAPTSITPTLVFTIYLYRHYINDAATFHHITRVYKQLLDPAHYRRTVGVRRPRSTSIADYMIDPHTFNADLYESACKCAFLIRGTEPSNLLTGSHGSDGSVLRIESHIHREALHTARRLVAATHVGCKRKFNEPGGVVAFCDESRSCALLVSKTVEELCSLLGFSSTSSFVFYQIILDIHQHAVERTSWGEHRVCGPGVPYAMNILLGKAPGPPLNRRISSCKSQREYIGYIEDLAQTLNREPWLRHILRVVGLDTLSYHDVEFALCEFRKLLVGDGLVLYTAAQRS